MISLYIPFIFAFEIDTSRSGLKYLDFLIDCWFLSEILFNFLTGFYEKGALVMNRKTIFFKYLKSWFLLDAISSLPFSFFYFWNDETNSVSNF
jgi:hypothetical protein